MKVERNPEGIGPVAPKTPVELASEKFREATAKVEGINTELKALQERTISLDTDLIKAQAELNKSKDELHTAILRAAVSAAKG